MADEDYTFDVVNPETVERLERDGKVTMPKKKIDIPKDKLWNEQLMGSKLLQGINSGSSIDAIALSLLDIVGNNEASAVRNARTMITAAECLGRMDSYKNLEKDGIVMSKVWIATPDNRTRISHLHLDGEEVKDIDKPFSNGCMFPGDAGGPPEEVWNCRCSMRGHVIGFKTEDGGISYVEYGRDETLHDVQMNLETKKRRKKDGILYTPLYHGTNFENVIGILESGELRGNVSNETETYGVSTTRNPNTAYGDVSLVLNKEMLEENYSIEPVYRSSIFGRDLAEERIDRTITEISKYVEEIKWNDTSKKNIQLEVLRRKLVQNFDNPDYILDETTDAYKIKKIVELANEAGIPLDDRVVEAYEYIKMFENREFDEEKYNRMKKKKS